MTPAKEMDIILHLKEIQRFKKEIRGSNKDDQLYSGNYITHGNELRQEKCHRV
jgi:hypothetical protein